MFFDLTSARLSAAEKVVLVHGIWMHGSIMGVIRRRLERAHGFDAFCFSYPSVRASVDENAALLADYVADFRSAPPHLVGHSLGGVLILRMLAEYPGLPAGRVVCIGSPLCGSRAAAALSDHRLGDAMLGNTLGECVVRDCASRWAAPVTEAREVGVIAGTHAWGLGRCVTRFSGPNDGTVAVSETRLPGIADHVELPVSHTGMMLSREVAAQTAAFLRHGRFDHRWFPKPGRRGGQ